MFRTTICCATLLGMCFVSACKTVPPARSPEAIVANRDDENFFYEDTTDDAIAAGTAFATATLQPKSGSQAFGTASFSRDKSGLKVTISVRNAKPGVHGIHIHEKGDCSAADASSAGAHFNPASLKHGSPDPSQFHMGDLGNIMVAQDGTGTLDLNIPAQSFHSGHNNWDVIVGKSLVLHGKADDFVTQPAGNSGDRIACGVITKQ